MTKVPSNAPIQAGEEGAERSLASPTELISAGKHNRA